MRLVATPRKRERRGGVARQQFEERLEASGVITQRWRKLPEDAARVFPAG